MVNQNFLDLLEQMKKTHESKTEDYASAGFYENFERQAIINSWFITSIDKVFSTMIAVKLARLATLLNKTTLPNNESIDDSFLDLTVYCGLWASYHKSQKKWKKETITCALCGGIGELGLSRNKCGNCDGEGRLTIRVIDHGDQK